MVTVKDWIPEKNLEAVLKILSDICNYKFDHYDLEAFRAGVADDSSFSYAFESDERMYLKIIRESGETVYNLELTLNNSVLTAVQTVIRIAKDFALTPLDDH